MYKVMIGDVMVLDRDLIKILYFAEDGIKVHKALMPNISDEEIKELDELAEKARKAAERLNSEFCI